jgi:hypothetical protein
LEADSVCDIVRCIVQCDSRIVQCEWCIVQCEWCIVQCDSRKPRLTGSREQGCARCSAAAATPSG